jgi:hypothetical protein
MGINADALGALSSPLLSLYVFGGSVKKEHDCHGWRGKVSLLRVHAKKPMGQNMPGPTRSSVGLCEGNCVACATRSHFLTRQHTSIIRGLLGSLLGSSKLLGNSKLLGSSKLLLGLFGSSKLLLGLFGSSELLLGLFGSLWNSNSRGSTECPGVA